MNTQPFSFDDWETLLRETVAHELQDGYREAIVKFRYWLRQTDKRPNNQATQNKYPWPDIANGLPHAGDQAPLGLVRVLLVSREFLCRMRGLATLLFCMPMK